MRVHFNCTKKFKRERNVIYGNYIKRDEGIIILSYGANTTIVNARTLQFFAGVRLVRVFPTLEGVQGRVVNMIQAVPPLVFIFSRFFT